MDRMLCAPWRGRALAHKQGAGAPARARQRPLQPLSPAPVVSGSAAANAASHAGVARWRLPLPLRARPSWAWSSARQTPPAAWRRWTWRSRLSMRRAYAWRHLLLPCMRMSALTQRQRESEPVSGAGQTAAGHAVTHVAAAMQAALEAWPSPRTSWAGAAAAVDALPPAAPARAAGVLLPGCGAGGQDAQCAGVKESARAHARASGQPASEHPGPDNVTHLQASALGHLS